MRSVFLLGLAVLVGTPIPAWSASSLLFTPQRIKRMKRDRDRQTQRWLNFESRLKSVPDSPERGFELALAYLVTADDSLKPQLSAWAAAHPCERRQLALITAASSLNLPASSSCADTHPDSLASLRDRVFQDALQGNVHIDLEKFKSRLLATPLDNASELYAAAEILSVLSRDDRATLRENSAQFFSSLPVQFLLNLKPRALDHPDWITHIAALALVALDPNSDSAQFLQGWAIEDRQMVQEGAGVAYELLWADPYLPGVGYQNLDPWWYDEGNARLLARSNWSVDACSVHIDPTGTHAENCPADWQNNPANFGHLQLLPVLESCVTPKERPTNVTAMLHRLAPNARIKTSENGKSVILQADRAGLWRVPSNITAKVCLAK